MSPTAPTEQPRRNPFEQFDDYEPYATSLGSAMQRAQSLIDAARSRDLTAQEQSELPQIVAQLRLLLDTQMDWNGTIAHIDRQDGSYDNATIDNRLRILLGRLRDLDIDHNRMWGTRIIRKATAWITEDLPNWFGVKWEQLKDNTKHVLKGAAVVGALGAAGTVGGYALAYGGLGPGLSALGGHLSHAWNLIGGGTLSAAVAKRWNALWGGQ